MKRALAALGTVLAVAIIPGALVVVGIIAAWKFVTVREDKVTDPTLRRIRAQAEQAERARELDEARVILPRTMAVGPSTTALSKVGVR